MWNKLHENVILGQRVCINNYYEFLLSNENVILVFVLWFTNNLENYVITLIVCSLGQGTFVYICFYLRYHNLLIRTQNSFSYLNDSVYNKFNNFDEEIALHRKLIFFRGIWFLWMISIYGKLIEIIWQKYILLSLSLYLSDTNKLLSWPYHSMSDRMMLGLLNTLYD